jgi:hypothetical protein
MSDHYNAFEISPVPVPGPDAVAPEPFRGIYGMPAFLTVPSTDLAGSVDFWTRGLGFFDLFSVPGRLVHLRRWAFQDVLLVPAEAVPDGPTGAHVSFACVLNEVDALVEHCRAIRPGSVSAPADTPWNTRDVEVITPENVRIVFTAGKPYDAAGEAVQRLADIGITLPGDNGDHA